MKRAACPLRRGPFDVRAELDLVVGILELGCDLAMLAQISVAAGSNRWPALVHLGLAIWHLVRLLRACRAGGE